MNHSHPLIQSFKAMRLRTRIAYILFVAFGCFLSLQGTLWAIDTSSALYISNIQIFNLGITRENFAAATEISGSALIDDAFMEADTLNAAIHEGPVEIPSMPPNNRIVVESAILDDGGSFTDFTAEAIGPAELDVPLLPFPAAVDDAFYIGCDFPCRILTFDIGQEGIGDWEVEWEYFNGTEFTTPITSALSAIDDRTNAFKNAGLRTVSFPMPSDFTETTVTGSSVESFYWRARVTSVSESTQQPIANRIWFENGQWWMWGQSQNINEELLYNLSVGGPDLVTHHQIFPGTVGVTASDSATMELGDTYSLHFDGAINFTQGVTGSDVCIICKDGAVRLFISGADEITYAVTGASSTTLTISGIPDAVDLPISTSPHIVDVISDGTDITLSVDGVGTANGTAQNVTDNANDWEFGSNQGFVFADTIYFLPDDTALAFETFDTQTEWDTGAFSQAVSQAGQADFRPQYLVEAEGGDGFWTEGTSAFNNTGGAAIFGFDGNGAATSQNSFYRFPGIQIPPGATITSAELRLNPATSESANTVNVLIAAIDEDDASAPTSFADAESRPRTTAQVAWNSVPAFDDTGTFDAGWNFQTTPDLTSVVQEMVDDANWDQGDAIVFYIEDNGSTAAANTTRRGTTFDRDRVGATFFVSYAAIEPDPPLSDDFIRVNQVAGESTPAQQAIPGWQSTCTRCTAIQARTDGYELFDKYSARLDARRTSGLTGLIDFWQDLTASEGETWSVQVNYAGNQQFGTWLVIPQFLDSDENVLQQFSNPLVESSALSQVINLNTLGPAPAGTTTLRILFQGSCTSSCASTGRGLFIDGITACVCDPAPNFPDASNVVANPNFETVFDTSGTWTSPSIALTQTDVSSSAIAWDSFAPFGSTVAVETNLNGAGFVSATNNAAIPGISEGDDLSGQTLQIRVTMTPGISGDLEFSSATALLFILINDDVSPDIALVFYELRSTPRVLLADLSPNGNNGFMSYPVQLTGIFSAITPLRSTRTPLSQQAAIGAGDFAAPVTGSDTLNLFATPEPGADLPLGGLADALNEASGFPREIFWVLMVLIGGIMTAGIVWTFTNGSELFASIILAGALILATIVGNGLIPGWVPFVAIIMLTAYNILRSRLPI